MSKREYAVLYLTGKLGVRGSAGGGNVSLNAGQHALDGPEHTGQLPATRLSYDPTTSGLVAVQGQAAIDELAALIAAVAVEGSFVPTYVAPAATFFVPADHQALWAMMIDNEGTLDIEGYLVEVD